MTPVAARTLAAACLMSSLSLAEVSKAEDSLAGPSFDCRRATSEVNRMICASSELSALDRKLASDYESTVHQGNIDGKKLQLEEGRWLRETRNACTTEACLKSAYRAQDEAILDMSLRAASPAAYDDSRPFLAPVPALSAARALIGTSCDGGPSQPLAGTSSIKGFHPVIAREGYVVPLSVSGYPFAFWLVRSESTPSQCIVREVAALPPPGAGTRFMQCHLSDVSHGFAVRSSTGSTLAYWSIADGPVALRREPIHVIGEQDLHCQAPETGE